ncbi:MAG: UbiA family prenyltransferase [Methanoregulaceae archaeon]|nr:UbiA family prenyltransferase [Methanoregulaceae archaeon]
METQYGNPGFSPGIFLGGAEGKLRSFYEFVMYSSLFVAFAAAGMVYTSYAIEGVIPSVAGIAIMFLVAFSVYNLNRKTDEAEDSINHQGRFAFTKKFEKVLFFSALACYALAVFIAIPYGIFPVLVTLVPLLAGILYSVPCLPRRMRYRRLKEIPVVKNLVVAFAWSLTLTFLPVSVGVTFSPMKVLLAFIFFTSYVFIASTIPDIRDREGDALSGVRTIPVILGVERTTMLLTGINLAVGGFSVLISVRMLPAIFTLMLAAGVAYIHLCIHSFYHLRSRDVVCDLLSDGQFIIFGGAIWAFRGISG